MTHDQKVTKARLKIKEKKHPYKWIAKEIGISQVHFSRILNGSMPMLPKHLDILKSKGFI